MGSDPATQRPRQRGSQEHGSGAGVRADGQLSPAVTGKTRPALPPAAGRWPEGHQLKPAKVRGTNPRRQDQRPSDHQSDAQRYLEKPHSRPSPDPVSCCPGWGGPCGGSRPPRRSSRSAELKAEPCGRRPRLGPSVANVAINSGRWTNDQGGPRRASTVTPAVGCGAWGSDTHSSPCLCQTLDTGLLVRAKASERILSRCLGVCLR